MRGLSWRVLAKRTYQRSWNDEVFGQAARLAFYFFFALFPLLLLLIMLSRSADLGSQLRTALLDLLRQILPLDVARMMAKTVRQLNEEAGAGAGAIMAALGAGWGALNGTWAIMTGLNNAYEVEEQRPWWRVLLVTLGLTISLSVLGLIALAANLYGAILRDRLVVRLPWLWPLAEWMLVVVLLLLSFAIIYRFAPNLKDKRWQWSSPGAVIAVGLWIGASILLRIYQEQFKSSQRVYGGLNSVAMLLLWLYFTGAAIFIGGEANSEIEKSAAEAGHPDVRKKDELRSGGDGNESA